MLLKALAEACGEIFVHPSSFSAFRKTCRIVMDRGAGFPMM